MKIFRALFRKKPTPAPESTVQPLVVANAAPMSVPIRPYYANLLTTISDSASVQLLQQHAAHPSGYVREAVLQRIAVLALPELLPHVVDRLNDWVPQVQCAARAALMSLLPLLCASQLLAVLPLILRLHSIGRADYADWLEQFELALIQTMTIEDLCKGARHPDMKVARACVHVLDKRRLLDAAALLDLIAERHDDIVLAHRALELCANLTPELQSAFCRSAARSHFGAIRAIAIRKLLSMESESREELAIAALLDVQSSIRYIAVSYLQAAGFDVRGHYRQLLQQGVQNVQRTRICLATLAALRDGADVELMKSYQSSEYPGVRTAARAAWFKLAEKDKDAIALAAMDDTAAGPRKLAAQLVHRQGAYIAFSTIRDKIEENGDAAFLLRLAETRQWNWLECVARVGLLHGVETARRLELARALGKWLRSSEWYERPEKEQFLFLSSGPVMDFFRQWLVAHPQLLALLLQHLAEHAPQDT